MTSLPVRHKSLGRLLRVSSPAHLEGAWDIVGGGSEAAGRPVQRRRVLSVALRLLRRLLAGRRVGRRVGRLGRKQRRTPPFRHVLGGAAADVVVRLAVRFRDDPRPLRVVPPDGG